MYTMSTRVRDMQDANGKFLLQKKKQGPMLGGQLVLSGGPSPSDTFLDVSQWGCPWYSQQMNASCFMPRHCGVTDAQLAVDHDLYA